MIQIAQNHRLHPSRWGILQRRRKFPIVVVSPISKGAIDDSEQSVPLKSMSAVVGSLMFPELLVEDFASDNRNEDVYLEYLSRERLTIVSTFGLVKRRRVWKC